MSVKTALFRSLAKSLRNISRYHHDENYLSLSALLRCQFPPGSGVEIVSEIEDDFDDDVNQGFFAIPNDCIELDEAIEKLGCNKKRVRLLRGCFETGKIPRELRSILSEVSATTGFETLRKVHKLENILRDSTDLYEIRKDRNKNVKYAVGDVIVHKIFGKGVITSWDETCGADSSWIERNSIHTLLRNGTEQPFYSLLMSDDTIRYCSQENLRLDMSENTEVTHDSIPFFFEPKKDGQVGYELNKHTRSIFPSDEKFREVRELSSLESIETSGSGIDQVLEASEAELLEMVRSDRALSSFALERLQTLWHNERGEDAAKLLEIANKAIGENELETADVILSGLFESYPDWSHLLNAMAHHSFVSNDYERALELCDASLCSNPNHLITLNALVEYNLTIGNLKDAKEALERSLDAMPFACIWPPELLGSLLSDDDTDGIVDFFQNDDEEDGVSD